MDKQAASGDVLQAARDRPAAGVWQGMDDLFCAPILSANGMRLRFGGTFPPWWLSVHLGQLPSAVVGVKMGSMQHMPAHLHLPHVL